MEGSTGLAIWRSVIPDTAALGEFVLREAGIQMPTYEYECRNCRRSYDVIQRISDPHLKRCPKCGSSRVKRCISLPAILTAPKTSAVARALPGPRSGLDLTVPPEFRSPSLGVRAARVL